MQLIQPRLVLTPNRSYAVSFQTLAVMAWARLQTSSRLPRAEEHDETKDRIDWPTATSSSSVERRRLYSWIPAEEPSAAAAGSMPFDGVWLARTFHHTVSQ